MQNHDIQNSASDQSQSSRTVQVLDEKQLDYQRQLVYADIALESNAGYIVPVVLVYAAAVDCTAWDLLCKRLEFFDKLKKKFVVTQKISIC